MQFKRQATGETPFTDVAHERLMFALSVLDQRFGRLETLGAHSTHSRQISFPFHPTGGTVLDLHVNVQRRTICVRLIAHRAL